MGRKKKAAPQEAAPAETVTAPETQEAPQAEAQATLEKQLAEKDAELAELRDKNEALESLVEAIDDLTDEHDAPATPQETAADSVQGDTPWVVSPLSARVVSLLHRYDESDDVRFLLAARNAIERELGR